MTVATDLDTLVGNAFLTTPKANAVTLAKKFWGVADGDGDNLELATAMLAMAILMNQRKVERAETDDSIVALPLEKLVTPEMERLLNQDKAVTTYDIVRYKQLSTSRSWCQG